MEQEFVCRRIVWWLWWNRCAGFYTITFCRAVYWVALYCAFPELSVKTAYLLNLLTFSNQYLLTYCVRMDIKLFSHILILKILFLKWSS